MIDTYFILTTSGITEAQYDESTGTEATSRKNNDGTKTILEVSNWNSADTESAFFGLSSLTHQEAVFEMEKAEWQ